MEKNIPSPSEAKTATKQTLSYQYIRSEYDDCDPMDIHTIRYLRDQAEACHESGAGKLRDRLQDHYDTLAILSENELLAK